MKADDLLGSTASGDSQGPPSTPDSVVICDKHGTPIAINTACGYCMAEDHYPFAFINRGGRLEALSAYNSPALWDGIRTGDVDGGQDK
jgi:hypothetical protein